MITFEGILRVSTFLLHFLSALFLLSISFRCGDSFVSRAYLDTATNTLGFPVIADSPCTDPHARECFFATPQSYATLQSGFEWNPLALLAAFEWLSASFALYYLKDTLWVRSDTFHYVVNSVCLLWNVAGIGIFLPFSLPLTLFQSALSVLALGASSVVQILENVKVGLEMDPSRVEAEDEQRRAASGPFDNQFDDKFNNKFDNQVSDGVSDQASDQASERSNQGSISTPPMADASQSLSPGPGKSVIFRRGSQRWVVPSVPDRGGPVSNPHPAVGPVPRPPTPSSS